MGAKQEHCKKNLLTSYKNFEIIIKIVNNTIIYELYYFLDKDAK